MATELKTKINGVVDNANFSNADEVVYNAKTTKLAISSNDADRQITVLTDEQMKKVYVDYIWNGSLDANSLRSVNEVGNNQIAVYQHDNPYVSEFLNLQPIRSILHSFQLSNYNQVNCSTCDTTIIKKVPITAPHAGVILIMTR